MKRKKTVGIIGGGNMGSAILSGIQSKYHVCVCEKDSKRRANLKREFHADIVDLKTLMTRASIVILAVKPQDFEIILSEIKPYINGKQLVISIAAGITTRYIEKFLGPQVDVIRAMPNLPAQIGKGFTALAKGKSAADKDIRMADEIFKCVGETLEIVENKMDAITAISGSGPAYLFLFAEAFNEAAKDLGLSQKEADISSFVTLSASSAFLELSDDDAATLREKVTSKAGTTEAALKEFKKGKFKEVFVKAVKAAKKRAKELSK